MIRRLAPLLRGPGSLAVAGVVVNGANLLANLVLARVLPTRTYGAVVELTGIFLILSMVGSGLQVAVVQRDTAIVEETRRATRWWVRRLRALCAGAIVVAALIGLAVCDPAAVVLSYPHQLALAEVAVAAALWNSISVERGLLQSRGAYEPLAVNLVIEGGLRVLATIVFVVAGLGVDGAGLGIIAGLVVGTEHAHRMAARTIRPARPGKLPPRVGAGARGVLDSTGPLLIPPPVVGNRRALAHDTSTAIGALLPLSALQNIDVVIVGRLNPHEVGAYAAIATACKVPVFIGLAVANFLLPEAARRQREGLHAGRALMTALAWVVAPGLALAAIGLVAPTLLLSLAFGPKLTGGAPALWILALAMTCLAATLLFTNYLLGVGRRRIVALVVGGVVITAGALSLAGGGLVATASASLACEAAIAVAAAVMVARSRPVPADTGATPGAAAGPVADDHAGTYPAPEPAPANSHHLRPAG